jgi:hypothetical protein
VRREFASPLRQLGTSIHSLIVLQRVEGLSSGDGLRAPKQHMSFESDRPRQIASRSMKQLARAVDSHREVRDLQ